MSSLLELVSSHIASYFHIKAIRKGNFYLEYLAIFITQQIELELNGQAFGTKKGRSIVKAKTNLLLHEFQDNANRMCEVHLFIIREGYYLTEDQTSELFKSLQQGFIKNRLDLMSFSKLSILAMKKKYADITMSYRDANDHFTVRQGSLLPDDVEQILVSNEDYQLFERLVLKAYSIKSSLLFNAVVNVLRWGYQAKVSEIAEEDVFLPPLANSLKMAMIMFAYCGFHKHVPNGLLFEYLLRIIEERYDSYRLMDIIQMFDDQDMQVLRNELIVRCELYSEEDCKPFENLNVQCDVDITQSDNDEQSEMDIDSMVQSEKMEHVSKESFDSLIHGMEKLQNYLGQVEKSLKGELEQTNIKLRATEGKLETTNKKLEKTEEELNRTKEELEQTNIKLGATEKELEITNKKLEKTEEELNRTKGELEQTNIKLEKTEEELNRTKEELEQTNIKLETTNTKLEKTEEGLKYTNIRMLSMNDNTNALVEERRKSFLLEADLGLQIIENNTLKGENNNLKGENLELKNFISSLKHNPCSCLCTNCQNCIFKQKQ